MNEEFNHVAQMLKQPLSDEPEALILDLTTIESWYSRMQFLYNEAVKEFEEEGPKAFPAKEGRSEIQRELEMESTLASLKKKKDDLKSICKAIEIRLILGESLLGFFRSTQNHTMQTQYKDANAYKQNQSIRSALGENQ